jgi:hypothetical protein
MTSKSNRKPRRQHIEPEMIVNPESFNQIQRLLTFDRPISIRIGSHIGIIHTVEQAIVWIHDQSGSELRHVLSEALNKLYEAKQVKTFNVTSDARKTLAQAFSMQNLLIR